MANYIRRVRVVGLFHQENELVVDFEQTINCIYGVNGTGKTVLINLIVNALRVNATELLSAPFESITILTAAEGKRQPETFLTVSKFEDELQYVFHIDCKLDADSPVGFEQCQEFRSGITYIPSFGSHRRRSLRQLAMPFDDDQVLVSADDLWNVINQHVSLTYVPLLRHSSSNDNHMSSDDSTRFRFATGDDNGNEDPNDRVLKGLQKEFSKRYASAQSDIARRLESLSSIIFEKLFLSEQTAEETSGAQQFVADFIQKGKTDEDSDKVESVVSQIRDLHLGIPESNIRNHYKTWFGMQKELLSANKEYQAMQSAGATYSELERDKVLQSWSAAYFNILATSRVYEKLEDAIQEIQKVFLSKQLVLSPFNRFASEVNYFLSGGKSFSFDDSGQFQFMSYGQELDITDLSSGEKHLVAILGRVCFSSFAVTSTFIADEPELSLHLEWQREILPAIKRLSPNIQIIVATHAPAIISNEANKIDIEECYRNG
ncbi:ATP-binding protein [Tichowtungia aerotolerans]|uniref:AAA family ATPase n=1 Tax=Tichowtungia aerotolerans TaxID=2697043 RepID=A0A6P1MEW1_9BACT|nr:AAA family ATPase [Tichowtungia aerotolerans]QHI69615.1 AAA family ATPase [Tichowtungia aerotolerans]